MLWLIYIYSYQHTHVHTYLCICTYLPRTWEYKVEGADMISVNMSQIHSQGENPLPRAGRRSSGAPEAGLPRRSQLRGSGRVSPPRCGLVGTVAPAVLCLTWLCGTPKASGTPQGLREPPRPPRRPSHMSPGVSIAAEAKLGCGS